MSGPQQLPGSEVEPSNKLLHMYQADGPPAGRLLPPSLCHTSFFVLWDKMLHQREAALVLFAQDEFGATAAISVFGKYGCSTRMAAKSSDGAPQDLIS